MLKRHKMGLIALAVAATLGSGMAVRTAVAREDVIPPPNPLALGEHDAAQLALLIPTANGMVSKAEYLRFMAAEFDRLNKGGNGGLDVRVLRSQLRPSYPQNFTAAGK